MKFVIALILAIGALGSSGRTFQRGLYNSRSHRIAGGVEATPHEIPSILNIGYHHCAATLIHPQWALTAATCHSMDELVAGDHNINKDEGTEQKIKVTEHFVHPEFGTPGFRSNDVKLLKLERPFQLNEYVQVAKLPPRNFHPTGNALVAGWGNTVYGEYNLSDVLHKIKLPFVSNDECNNIYGGDYWEYVDDSMICAGVDEKGTCQGDFGGPMFCDSPNGTVFCGIASWDFGCGRVGYPTVYARTSHFLDWIQQTTGITV